MNLALKTAQNFIAPETGFVHENKTRIPTYENLCYILALFKTKEKEEIEKALKLLEHILYFQNEKGFFPTYLHEFPYSYNSMEGVNHLKPLKQLLAFKSVIPFRQKLIHAIEKLESALKDFYLEKQPTSFNAYELLKEMNELPAFTPELYKWCDSHSLAKAMLRGEKGDWLPLVWHTPSKSYVGPSFKERFHGHRPETTLLSLMLGVVPEKPELNSVEAALIDKTLDAPAFKSFKHEDVIEGYRFGILQEPKYAISVMDKNGPEHIFHQPGVQLLKIMTPNGSLVIEGNTAKSSRFEFVPGGVDLYLTLKESVEVDDREKQREISIYADDRWDIRSQKGKATLFHWGDPIIFEGDIPITLTISVEQGQGEFATSIVRENRPSQIIQNESFDRAISLRTLRRSPDLTLKASFRL